MAAEVGPGVCLALGGTHQRTAFIEDELTFRDFSIRPRPETLEDLLGWIADGAQLAEEGDGEWMVMGVPGPVSVVDGRTMVGPMVNVAGMDKQPIDLLEALEVHGFKGDTPQDKGIELIVVNDGTLAAHASENYFRTDHEAAQSIGAVIVGTGVGFGAVYRDSIDPTLLHTFKIPGEIGHIGAGDQPLVSFEDTISGPAIKRLNNDVNPADLPATHPWWDVVGGREGRLSMMMSLILGLDLVVVTGGVGVGANHKHMVQALEYLNTISEFGNGVQRAFVPLLKSVSPLDAEKFEMWGAINVMREARADQAEALAKLSGVHLL